MNHTQPDGAQGAAIIEPTQRQLQTATTVEELSAEETDSAVDMEVLDFKTTAELEPLDEIVGQSRAMSALEVGLGIQQPGYNIFAAGLTGQRQDGDDPAQPAKAFGRVRGRPTTGSTCTTSTIPISPGPSHWSPATAGGSKRRWTIWSSS